MALAVNIEDLLNKQKIESNRIEFKKGWNPASIYHSVCAFANDIDDLGGGYIVVGVDTEEDTGLAIRPVEGVPIEQIDGILQDMVGFNNKMSPYYLPRTSVEEVDGKPVLVIWCPAGIPTIQNELKKNGSPRAIVVTDDDRTFFRITIPCHEAAGNIIADVAKTDTTQATTQTTTQTTTQRIIEMMKANSEITIEELAATCEITRDGVNYHIRNLKKKNKIRRIGGDFGGHWEVIDDKVL